MFFYIFAREISLMVPRHVVQNCKKKADVYVAIKCVAIKFLCMLSTYMKLICYRFLKEKKWYVKGENE